MMSLQAQLREGLCVTDMNYNFDLALSDYRTGSDLLTAASSGQRQGPLRAKALVGARAKRPDLRGAARQRTRRTSPTGG